MHRGRDREGIDPPPPGTKSCAGSILDSTFADYSLIPQSYEPIRPDHVLVTLRQTARLRDSDQRLTELIYMLWHPAGGRVQETWTFTDRDEALEAGGLSA
jgi:hypothetical protein